MSALLLGLVFAAALGDWVAVARGWKRVERILKPATLALLFAWLLVTTGLRGSLLWFGIGALCSLAGDTFLLFSERWFVAGLAAFLLAHVAYIVGFNQPLPDVSLLWSLGLAIVLGLSAARLLRRIVDGLVAKNQRQLVRPVVLYGTVLTLMLLSALLTSLRTDWQATPALLVSAGAILFFGSDMLLAWDRFVTPVKNGRVLNMIAYHLGQIALIAGAALQFKK